MLSPTAKAIASSSEDYALTCCEAIDMTLFASGYLEKKIEYFLSIYV